MKDSQLIFIISQPRSGSTMLQALLSNNKDVATTSEPWILLPFLSLEKEGINQMAYQEEVFLKAFRDFKDKNLDEDFYKKTITKMLLDIYKECLKSESYLLDKTPRYYEIIDEIIEYFPNAKVILLKRNPFAIVSSMYNTWYKGSDLFNFYTKYYRDLTIGPRAIHQANIKYESCNNIRTIYYENLVKNPEKEVKSLYRWIGIKYDSKVLNFKRNTKYQGNMGDPKGVYKNKRPVDKSLNKWREKTSDPFWKSFLLGYQKYLINRGLWDSFYEKLKDETLPEDEFKNYEDFAKIKFYERMNLPPTTMLIKEEKLSKIKELIDLSSQLENSRSLKIIRKFFPSLNYLIEQISKSSHKCQSKL